MACVCDECDEEIDLDEANERHGLIICDDCIDEREGLRNEAKLARFLCKRCRTEDERPHRRTLCRTCARMLPSCALIEKNEAKDGICPVCAHAYELAIFTPADHDAANCDLCKMTEE